MRFFIKTSYAFFICAMSITDAFGQIDSVYTSQYLESSTTFGSTTLGVDALSLGGGRTDFVNGSSVTSGSFGRSFIPRMTIGGIHFWGHADFYVSLPLSFLTVHAHGAGLKRITNVAGIETGARVYPWKLSLHRISPFAGLSFRLHTYGHKSYGVDYGKGNPEYQTMVTPIQIGATYTTARS